MLRHISHLARGRGAAFFLGAGCGGLAFSQFNPPPLTENFAASGQPLTANFIADAAAQAAPAVVNIKAATPGNIFAQQQSSGSGFIIHENGTVLTNAHVVKDASQGVTVTLQDGRSILGTVQSTDTMSDIAIIKLHVDELMPTIKLGKSADLRVGEWVVAMGSPLSLSNTVTAGIVSALGRQSAEIGLDRSNRMNYIQTDAAINVGNSGGPLLNLNGEVIGISTMKAMASDGISFAIPIDEARRISDQLAKHGRVHRPYLGIKMLTLDPKMMVDLKREDPDFPKVDHGVLVPQVMPSSPAHKAGMKAGDVIVEFDGKPIKATREIVDILGHEVGRNIEVVVIRGNGFMNRKKLVVTSESMQTYPS